MKNKLLVSAQKCLPQDVISSFQDENILELTFDENGRPFAFLIVEKDFPHSIIISFAADFYNVMLASRLSIDLAKVADVQLGEEFFISIQDQKLYWGDEAAEMATLEGAGINENLQILIDSTPINDLKC